MPSTMLKPQTAEPAVSDFETAKARWKKIAGKRREMLARHEGMAAALSLTSGESTRNVAQSVRDQAAPYLDLAGRRRRKLIGQIEDLVEEIEEFTRKNQDENEIWQAARRRETSRLAGELQPRHRAAVKAMAKALEALSLAMSDEIEVRADLARVAPERDSAKLPDCSTGLAIGTLADWRSPASEWARNVRKLKILE